MLESSWKEMRNEPVLPLRLLAPFLKRIVKAVRAEGQQQEDFFA